MKKSWVEKRDIDKKFKIKINPKKFSDIPAGTKMLIPTPRILDNFVNKIPEGLFFNSMEIRKKLADKYKAETTCPLVTGILLRIISEAAFEEYQNNQDIKMITPFWRVVHPDSNLAGKLACGKEFIIANQIQERIKL